MAIKIDNAMRRALGLKEITPAPSGLGVMPEHVKELNSEVDPVIRAYDNVLSLGGTKEEAAAAADAVRRMLRKKRIR